MNVKQNGRHILLALGVLLVVVLLGAYIFVHTQKFNRILAHEIIERAQQDTGAQVTLGKMLIHWSQLTMDFYGVAVLPPSRPQPPLFTCGHLGVGLKIQSIWKRQIDLDQIVLDRPVLRILVDPQGRANLPYSASTSSEPVTERLFGLAVRHLKISAGQIDYNNAQVPVSAELRDLRAKVQFSTLTHSYEGTVSYDHGRIAAGTLAPFEHQAEINFEASPSEFVVHSLDVSAGETHLLAQAVLTDYSRPRMQGSYQAAISTPELARILNEPSLPLGEVQTSGSFVYDTGSNQRFLEAVSVTGRMEGPEVVMHIGGLPTRARQVHAKYVLRRGDLRVEDLAAEVLGGALSASFSMSDLAAPQSKTSLNASLQGASLWELTRIVPPNQREGVRLAGRANAELEAEWRGTPSDATVHVRASIYGPLRAPSPTTIPVNGFLDVRYDGVRDTATFAPSTLRTVDTQISLSGVLSTNSSLNVQANTRDLHEIAQLVSSLSAASRKPNSRFNSGNPPDLRGSASFAGQIAGSAKSPRVHGQLTGKNIVVQGTAWRAIQAHFDLSASSFSVENATLKGQGQTSIALNGSASLQDWSLTPASPLSLQANASGVSLSDVEHIARLQYPVTGNLAANISIHGSEKNPAGQVSLEISQASAWGESVNHLWVRLQGDGNSAHASAQLQVPAGSISADLMYAPQLRQYDVRVNAPNLALDRIQLLQRRSIKLGGTASVSASGKGTIDRPQLDAHLEIPQVQVEDQTISQLRAELTVANEHANFTVNSTVVHGYLQARANVDLRGNYLANASLDVRALPLEPLLATYAPKLPHGFQGQTEIHASLSGPLRQPEQLKAQVEVPTLEAGYRSVHIALVEPMKLAYANGVFSIEKADLKGTGTQLSVQGTVPLRSTQPLNVAANGTLDLAILQSLSPNIKSSGQIDLRATAQGSLSHPAMQGQLRIVNARFFSEAIPLGLEGVNGQIRASGNRIEIEQLKGAAGGGTISATGFFVYGPKPSFSLSAQAQSIRLRYPEGIRSILDAKLDFAGSPSSSSLTGRVLVDRLSFTQQFDIATLMGEVSAETASALPSAFEQNTKLNVAVDSSSELNLSSNKLSIAGSANLTVTGNLANPVVLGRVSLTRGEVFFIGKRYEIDNGTIDFANPTRTEPVLNIYAKTTVQQYDITLNFVGPVDRLRTSYTSDPPLSETDIINLIAFGQTAEQAASSPSTPASVGAESVLAQAVGSQVSSKLEKIAGISQITLDPLATNSQSDPGAQVSIQQRVSGSLLVTLSTDVTSTQADTVEVQYTPNKRWTISVIRDEYDGYGIDVRIRKVF